MCLCLAHDPALCVYVCVRAALCEGIEAASGKPSVPFSVSGSLPLVDVLKAGGFGMSRPHCAPSHPLNLALCADVQIVGFGLMSTYHANNEYCLLSGMRVGFKSLAHVIASLNAIA